ncbi:hypothetical protein [Rhodococcoides kroppenstedtii]|uniref:hypothetical protein n=1 Tax=Rhodococcoides kroppenstedtii TaxID=293050 RepID=UPI0011136688|nr:hypothetical protein [Rhodococcus kroppenstedtii]
MSEREVLGCHLKVGQPVEYTGPEDSNGILASAPPLHVLHVGHPGRIRDPTPQHVMVDWVGLEHEVVSYAAGFVNERRFEDDQFGSVKGLQLLSEAEYVRRSARVTSEQFDGSWGNSST